MSRRVEAVGDCGIQISATATEPASRSATELSDSPMGDRGGVEAERVRILAVQALDQILGGQDRAGGRNAFDPRALIHLVA